MLYFFLLRKKRWVDVLDKLSDAINNSVNRTIGIEPNKVNFENREIIFKKLYGSRAPPIECKFSFGDIVRIPVKKNIFEKGYKPSWSKELYKVTKVLNDGSVCYYQVEHLNGDSVEKKYYDNELNLTIRNEISQAS